MLKQLSKRDMLFHYLNDLQWLFFFLRFWDTLIWGSTYEILIPHAKATMGNFSLFLDNIFILFNPDVTMSIEREITYIFKEKGQLYKILKLLEFAYVEEFENMALFAWMNFKCITDSFLFLTYSVDRLHYILKLVNCFFTKLLFVLLH